MRRSDRAGSRGGPWLRAAIVALALSSGSRLAAEELPKPPAAVAEEAIPLWRHAIYKTVTNQTLANAADVALFVAVYGATPAMAAGFLAFNVATHATVYYAHEFSWGYFGPPVGEDEQAGRLVQKAVSYRILSIARTAAIGGLVTGGAAAVSLTYTVAAEMIDGAIYVANETLWWAFGPRPASP